MDEVRKESTTRGEHLQWCKDRALEYVDMGDLSQAWASMTSDLRKHSETINHSAIEVGFIMIYAGQISTPDEMRKFILGFN